MYECNKLQYKIKKFWEENAEKVFNKQHNWKKNVK